MDTTKPLPPELLAYFDGMLDAKDATPEQQELFYTVVPIMFESILEAAQAATLAEREACAAAIDALAADEERSEQAAQNEGHRAVARAMRKAYEYAAASIRART